MKIILVIFCLTLLVEPALMGQTAQGDRVSRLLEELSNASGPSGFEGPVREIIVRGLHALALKPQPTVSVPLSESWLAHRKGRVSCLLLTWTRWAL